MRNKLENEKDDFPASSFIQVGCQLIHEDEASKLLEMSMGNKSKHEDHLHDHEIIMLAEKSERSISISGVSLNSFDVDAVDDMIATIKRKNIVIYSLGFVWILTVVYLYFSLIFARDAQKELQDKIDDLMSENNQLRFEYVMKHPTDDALFELDNCYFNFKASMALGSCAEEITRSAYDWYEWGTNLLYSEN